MAEPTPSPALPSTADTTPYVPIAWSAVAALVVAGLFAVLLLVLGVTAFTNKKPLLQEELLVLPVIAVVLSFAARRMIRNSEGTRTGENLANAAWWLALVLGLAYTAYLFAISFAIRREAASEVAKWVELVREEKTVPAFYQTLAPGMRQSVSKTETAQIESRFRDELLAFNGTDLVRLARRNPGALTFTPDTVADWSYKPGTIDCTFNGVVTCPEGRFPVVIPLKGIEGVTAAEGVKGGGRQWMIARPPGGGFIQQDKATRTTYGWMVVLLELNGNAFAKAFIDHVGAGPTGYPFLYRAFVSDPGDPKWAEVVRNPRFHLPFAIPLAMTQPGAFPGGVPDGFFAGPDGVQAEAPLRDRFLASWNLLGVYEAGRRLKDGAGNVPDKESALKLTDTAIELRVPVEIPLASANKLETARGRLVLVCKDPALLAELKKLKEAAVAGEKPFANPPAELEKWAAINWRVARIESDLRPVSVGAPNAPGAAGGPPGMPGGH